MSQETSNYLLANELESIAEEHSIGLTDQARGHLMDAAHALRAAHEPPASEIEAEIMEQLAQRPHDRLCVEALALIQRLRMRAPSAADHYDCAACDQPGEHCGADK